MTHPLLLRLRRLDRLSPEEETALIACVTRERAVGRGEEFVPQGSSPSESILMLDGFSARSKVLQDGQRQITALHMAGDFVDLHSFLLKAMDHSVVALTDCRVAPVPHDKLRALTDRYSHLARVLWLTTLIDAAIHREWLVAMGRRSAPQHLAHLMCELYLRLEVISRTEKNGSFDLPLSQAEIADTLGMSLVHTNRVLGELRRDGLLEWRARLVTIPDFRKLAEFAEFDPIYLNLDGKPL
jgi:CRP-like cAMP-binding protein